MSTLYLIEAHNSTVADSRITNVQVDPDGADNLITGVTINGSFPVLASPDITIEDVNTVSELNTAKYTELLALYPGFTYIAYEDFLASPSVNSPNCANIRLGERVTTSLGPSGILETTSTALSDTPDDAILIWEAYEIVETIVDNRVLLVLNELDPDADLTVEASFNGGTDFQAYTSGVVGTIPLAEQGSSLVVKFTSTVSDARYLASWAVLY
jgi:hypothetical protein